MAIKDDMEDVQEAVINELITENGITNTLADGQVTETKIANGAVTAAKLGSDVSLTPADGSITPAKLDRAYLESTGGTVSGNVGIGVTPTEKLHIGGSVGEIKLKSSGAEIEFTRGSSNILTASHPSGRLTFQTGGTNERARIDSAGNVLVGKTSTSILHEGSALFPDGRANYASTAGPPLAVGRPSGSGDLISGYLNTSLNLRLGALSDGSAYFGGSNNNFGGLRLNHSPRSITPCEYTGANYDNSVDLGQSSVRYDDIYATNGSIQTSDANEKQDIEALSEAEQRVAVACKGLLRKFRWKSAVEEKGEEARIHFGIIAQDLKAAFEAEGLDAGRYAMFISSTWTDEETGEEKTRLGVRYSELLAFIISAI